MRAFGIGRAQILLEWLNPLSLPSLVPECLSVSDLVYSLRSVMASVECRLVATRR